MEMLCSTYIMKFEMCMERKKGKIHVLMDSLDAIVTWKFALWKSSKIESRDSHKMVKITKLHKSHEKYVYI